ncbi:MAG: hypothetical protein ACHQDC_08785, partial [Acidimicrobiales bacterium]
MARDELLDPTPRDDDDLVEGDVDGHPEGAATDLTVAGELTGDASSVASLRPRTLAEFVGQSELKRRLSIILEAARRRGQSADH